MKSTKRSLAMALALTVGALGVACSPEENNNSGSGGTGGKGGSGGSTAGRGGSSGGSSSTGGTTGGSSSTGGTGGSTGGTGGSTGGTGGSTGGTGGAGGGSGGSAGAGGSTGGSGGTGGSMGGTGGSMSDAGKSDGMGGAEAGGGALALTVTGFTPGMNGRNCYPPGSNSMGNQSPKMDWGPPPAGTMSWALTTEDLTARSAHQVVCNIPVAVLGQAANVKGMIPAGAESGTGHNKPGHIWYGPGAGDVRQYEIRIWAIPTEKLPMGCKDQAGARAAMAYLKSNMNNKANVLASDGKTFWGNVMGRCQ